MAKRRPPPVGINVHPRVGADDCLAYLSNAAQKCVGLANRTGDGEWLELREQLVEAVSTARRKSDKLNMHIRTLAMVDPETFARARDGDIPWPGVEDPETFTPRCRCYDQCGVHDRDSPKHDRAWLREQAEAGNESAKEAEEEIVAHALEKGWICNCAETCRQHDRPSGCKVRG